MKEIDKIKEKHKNGEISDSRMIELLLESIGVVDSFTDALIKKYSDQKIQCLKNLKTMASSSKYPYYDATFNNTLLFLFDLEDIKCRSGLYDE